ncbi:class I SAM-dependent methyltransferase [Herpetosiphon llansteffanensis]|uniref:class I SAM-dependent methyltransferase n=1 Tax=Herpetosiphon llansteffanensis TaxID=2094568 RepID=UPI000D7CD5F4|nr:class I SAM-dependent methyltransferase [Herpetosiphon llansteffanensis]
MSDNRQRFSNRVADYVQFRPNYPSEIFGPLHQQHGFGSSSIVADIGAGTGIWSEQLLEHGATVYAIEPNAPMREASLQLAARYPQFQALDGSAEATGLADQSVNWITAAQAFHWFEPNATRREWQRILRPEGWVALIWNQRALDATPFLRQYEALLHQFGTDYSSVKHTNIEPQLISDFFGQQPACYTAQNAQYFDQAGLLGRAFSSSYTPTPEQPSYQALRQGLIDAWEQHQVAGNVAFLYTTTVYVGRFS